MPSVGRKRTALSAVQGGDIDERPGKQARYSKPGQIAMRYFICLTSTIFSLLAVASPSLAQLSPITDKKEALVRQYYILTRHEHRYREIYSRQVKLALTFCTGKPCQQDLDRAIDAAVIDAIAEYEQASITLLAQRLREEDLLAAIAYAQSPAAQAILSAEEGMNDQLAAIGHATTRTAYAGISTRFCPSHRDVCVAQNLLGMAAAQSPK